MHHEKEHDRRGDRGADGPADKQPQRQPGDEHHHQRAKTDRQRRAQIGLKHDQPGRNQQDHHRRHDRAPAPDLVHRQHRIEPGEHQHDPRLHQFRRLERHEPEIEPALAAPADPPDQFDQDQQHAQQRIAGQRSALEPVLRHTREQHGHDQKAEKADDMHRRPGLQPSTRGRIEHCAAENGQCAKRNDHLPRLARQRLGDIGARHHCGVVPLVGVGAGGACGVAAWARPLVPARGWRRRLRG